MALECQRERLTPSKERQTASEKVHLIEPHLSIHIPWIVFLFQHLTVVQF